MTIQEVKDALGVSTLEMNWFVAEDGTETPWLRSWDNTQRVAVLMHKDVHAVIANDANFASLGIKHSSKETAKGAMTTAVIVAYKPADVSI